MRKKFTLLSLLAFLFFITDAVAQCTTGSKLPSNNYAPLNNGAYETINSNCRPGEYALVTNISSTRVYTFASSVATDYVTITDINNGVYAHGPSGLTWIPPANAGSYIKYFIHADASCSDVGTSRTRYISSQTLPTCGTPTDLAVSNITSNSARISWTAPVTAPGSGYEVYVNTAMITPVPSATPTATAPSAATAVNVISGLNPSATYYYWVRSNCGSQKGVWVYGGGFTTIPFSGCNGATYGLNPQQTYTPSCTGTVEQISLSKAGEYANVSVLADKQYTFSSSVATDYITITNTDGTVVYATGTSPVVWPSSAVSGVIRYYIHTNANCGTEATDRERRIICANTACGLPANLAITNITANSCKVTWSAPGVLPSGGYELFRNTTGNAPLAITTATLTAATNIINPMTGLTENTTYYYWVRSVCGTSKSDWVPGGSFTTNPLSGCNGAFNGMYPEQTFTPAGTGSSEVIVTDAKGGQYTNVNIVANRQYTFTSSGTGDYITVTNEAGNAVFATGASPLRWTSNMFTGVVRYYIHSNAGCAAQATNRTRSITSAPISACPWATGINVSAITSTSALISWTPNSAESGISYWVFVSSNAYTAPSAGATTTGGTRTNGVIVNQLQPNTVYYYFVSKSCTGGGSTPWVSGGTFKTLASIYESCNGAFYGIFPMETFTPACTGTLERITDSSAASQFSYVNLSADKQYTFQSSIGTDYLTITNEAGTQVLAKGSSPLTWNSGAFSGTARYYLHSQVACGSSSSTRSKSIKCTDICVAPSVSTVANIAAQSATISWPGNASSYQYYYATTNTAPADNYPTTANITTTRTADLTNLTPGATYYVWVRSVCGNTTSAWVAGTGFTTFAGGCFTGTLYPNASFNPSCNGGPETITTQAYAAEYSVVNITASTSYIFGSSVATDYVTITNAAGTVLYAYGPAPLSWSSDNTTGAIRFYLHANAECGAENIDRIKTITCVSPNTCGLPTNILVSNITSNSAKIDYTAPANAPTVGYQFMTNTTGTEPLDSVPAVANTINTYGTVSGLLPATTYYSWVRSVCITGAGLWVQGPSFTTIAAATTGCNGAVNGVWPLETFTPACSGNNEVITTSAFAGQFTNISLADNKVYTFTSSIASDYITITNEAGTTTYAAGASPLIWYSGTTSGVARYYVNSNASCGVNAAERTKSIKCSTPVCDPATNVYVTNITSNSATFGWGTSASSWGYQYYVSTQSTTPTASSEINSTNTTILQLQNLTPQTVYYYWIRVNCGSGIFSAWTTGSFTTSNLLLCNGTGVPSGASGLYPSQTFQPSCTGAPEVITSNAWPGEYANVAVIANKTYTFSSSFATDYLTITSADGNTLLVSGTTPVVWSSGNTSGVVRYFLHSDSSCGSSTVIRTRSVRCAEPCTAPVTPTFTQVAPTCTGSNIAALPAYSNEQIPGTWSPAINNQATTTYTFTPAAGQCATTATMTIVVTNPTIVPAFTQVAAVCRGGNMSPLPVDSNNGINGSWSPAVNNQTTTTYTFTPSPGQCAVTTTMTIVVNASNVVPVFDQVAPICAGSYLAPLPVDSTNGINGSWSPAINNMATTTYTFTPAPGQCAVTTTMTISTTLPPNRVPTFAQVGPVCAGTSLSALPVYSNEQIQGTWSPALNNQATTTYTFTPAAGQCAVNAIMIIEVTPANIVPTFTQVAPICAGSYLEPLPVDSNNGINGSWSPALNNMATTTYTFTPAPGQCAVPTTMTIATTLPPNRVPTFTQVGAICAGDYLEALPVYSNEQIQGTWSPALNNQATTTYTFTPAAGQCALPATMTIMVNVIPQAPSNVSSCGAYTLPALPAGYFYTGTNSEGTPLAAGTPIYYSQTVYLFYDNVPCSTQTSFEVTVQPIFNSTVVNGDTITALMAGTGVTYEWYRCTSGAPVIIAGATGQSFVPVENGSYQVKITVPGCGSVYSDCVLIDDLGTENNVFLGELKIHPNPSHGQFTVETGTVTSDKITVIDNLGRTIKTIYPFSAQTQIDIAECADGIYLIKIENKGQTSVKKVMLRK